MNSQTQLHAMDLFDQLKPEKEQPLDRVLEVKINKTLEEITSSYEGFIENADNYDKAIKLYSENKIETPKSYSSKDIEKFSILLANYQKLGNFRLSGFYLSGLCNNCNDSEITIHTAHFDSLIDYLGYENNGKIITIQGNAGYYVGCYMKNGTINIQGNAGYGVGGNMKNGTINVKGNAGDWVGLHIENGTINVQGNAGDLVGNSMNDGTINVQGNAGSGVGWYMEDGTITINGDYKLSDYINGGDIYHKGKMIVGGGKLIRERKNRFNRFKKNLKEA